MNDKIALPALVRLLALRAGFPMKLAEDFLRALFREISLALESGDSVKLKGIGTFKVVDVEARKSVNVSTGEDHEIPAHRKVVFVPSKELAAMVNEPFSMFETVELDEDFPLDDEIGYVGDPESEMESDSQSANIEERTVNHDKVSDDVSLQMEQASQNDLTPLSDDSIEGDESDERESVKSDEAFKSEESVTPDKHFTSPETHTSEERASSEDVATEEEGEEKMDDSDEESIVYTYIAEHDPADVASAYQEPASTCPEESEFEETASVKSASVKSSSEESSSEESTFEEHDSDTSVPEFIQPVSVTDGGKTKNQEVGPAKKSKFGIGFLVGALSMAAVATIVFVLVHMIDLGKWREGNIAGFSEKELIEAKGAKADVKESVDSAPVDSVPAVSADRLGNEEIAPTNPSDGSPLEEMRDDGDNASKGAAKVYDTITKTRYLTTMAKDHYGNYNLWPYIYEENKAILGHPDRIKPGTQVVIPDLKKYGVNPDNPDHVAKAKRKGVEIYSRYK